MKRDNTRGLSLIAAIIITILLLPVLFVCGIWAIVDKFRYKDKQNEQL